MSLDVCVSLLQGLGSSGYMPRSGLPVFCILNLALCEISAMISTLAGPVCIPPTVSDHSLSPHPYQSLLFIFLIIVLLTGLRWNFSSFYWHLQNQFGFLRRDKEFESKVLGQQHFPLLPPPPHRMPFPMLQSFSNRGQLFLQPCCNINISSLLRIYQHHLATSTIPRDADTRK